MKLGGLRQEGLRYISLLVKTCLFLHIESIGLHIRLIICDTPPKRTHTLPLQDADSRSGKGKALKKFFFTGVKLYSDTVLIRKGVSN